MTADPILLPFETDLSPADEAMEALYDAFSGHSSTADGMCRQCFDEDYERAVRRISDPRRAAFDQISPLYWEHPGCAGPDRAMFFLPRVIELGFWEDYEIERRMIQMNVWAWPDAQQDALRAVLSIATVGWFSSGDPAPLKGPPPCPHCGKNCVSRPIIGEDLLRALFLLRVDPFSVFPWLARVDTARAALTIAETVPNGARIGTEEYTWPRGDGQAAAMAAAEAINTRIVMAACDAVSPDLLSDLFFKYADTQPGIAEWLSSALDCDSMYRVAMDDAALVDGLKAIAAGIAAAAA